MYNKLVVSLKLVILYRLCLYSYIDGLFLILLNSYVAWCLQINRIQYFDFSVTHLALSHNRFCHKPLYYCRRINLSFNLEYALINLSRGINNNIKFNMITSKFHSFKYCLTTANVFLASTHSNSSPADRQLSTLSLSQCKRPKNQSRSTLISWLDLRTE